MDAFLSKGGVAISIQIKYNFVVKKSLNLNVRISDKVRQNDASPNIYSTKRRNSILLSDKTP